MAEFCSAIGIPARTVRDCCQQYLGMSAKRFVQLRRMQLARRALRGARPAAATVAGIARQHGFAGLGRFAANYRTLFGELPSATLHQQAPGRRPANFAENA